MNPIPVHVVTGPRASGKSALIARLCAGRHDWLGFVNTQSHVTLQGPLRPLPGGCPCCTGRIVLQVGLVRALRDTHAVRAFVELVDERHAASFEQTLADPGFAMSVVAARRLVLPVDAGLRASDLEHAGDR